jgi:IclR family acetate operon transcriptional repressor
MAVEVNLPSPARRRSPKRAEDKGKPDASEQYHLRAITRAIDVLECFSDGRAHLNLKDLGGLVDLPESTLFRILLTLESRGYLTQNQDGTYQLAAKIVFGQLHVRAEALRERVRPLLEALARKFDETASLGYLFGDHIRVLDVVETFHAIRMTNRTGRVLPPHCSSLGKAISAFQRADQVETILECYGLYRRTPNTVTDRARLLEEFRQIRETGYAVDREESVAGGVCIGAPIFTVNNLVEASISVSTPLGRMTSAREQEVTQAVLEASREAARLLRP